MSLSTKLAEVAATRADRGFTAWLALADREVQALAGLSIDDLMDGPSRDSYDDGMSPDDYARDLLAAEGF